MLSFHGTEEDLTKGYIINGITNRNHFYLCHAATKQVITDINFKKIPEAVKVIERWQLKGFSIIRGKELLANPDGWNLLPGKKLQDFIS